MKLENSFEVKAAPETAWELLLDVPRVIPCMPGAELVETVDDSTWKARMRVKLGPISLSFLTDVHREQVDEAARSVRLAASAREERGRGAATATMESRLESNGDTTRVTTLTDLTLSGPAAQYGRGLVQGVTEQLLKSFAACLEQQLAPAVSDDGASSSAPASASEPRSGSPAAAPVGGAPSPAASPVSPPPPPQRPISGLSVGAAAARTAVARFLSRVRARVHHRR
jgi:carbon monoxide dehydrogenase subunit G